MDVLFDEDARYDQVSDYMSRRRLCVRARRLHLVGRDDVRAVRRPPAAGR